jgi:hypothetical protein
VLRRYVYPPAECAACGGESDDLYYVDPKTGGRTQKPYCAKCFERLLHLGIRDSLHKVEERVLCVLAR